MVDCNSVPNGYFPYRVQGTDIGAGGTNTITNIAQKFDVQVYRIWEHVFDPARDVMEPHIEVGQIIPIPNPPPIGYISPCAEDQLLNDFFSLVMMQELMSLINYTKILGIAATATPETINSPHQSTFQANVDQGQLISQSLLLAGLLGEEVYNDTATSFGFNPDDFTIDPAVIANIAGNSGRAYPIVYGEDFVFSDILFPTFDAEDFATQQNNRVEIRDLIDQANETQNNWNILGQTQENSFATFQATLDAVGDIPDDPIFAPSSAYVLAGANDIAFNETIEIVGDLLANWNETGEQALLNELSNKITLMEEHKVRSKVWIEDITKGFRNFYDLMNTRQQHLLGLKEMIDHIDWLRMTPEERIELEQKEQIIAAFDHCGIDISTLTLDLDIETFKQEAVAVLTPVWDEKSWCIAGPQGRLNRAGLSTSYTHLQYRNSASMAIEGFMMLFNEDPYLAEIEQGNRQNAFEIAITMSFFVLGFVPVLGTFIDLVDSIILLASGNVSAAALNLTLGAVFDADEYFDMVRIARNSFESLTDTGRRINNIVETAGRQLDNLPDGRTVDELLEEAEAQIARASDGIIQDAEDFTRRINNSNPVRYTAKGNGNYWTFGSATRDEITAWANSIGREDFEKMLKDRIWVNEKGEVIEIAAIYNPDGKLHVAYQGNATSANIPDDISIEVGSTLVHSHPGGATFSLEDIQAYFSQGLEEIRAIGPGGLTYVLRTYDDETRDIFFNLRELERTQNVFSRDNILPSLPDINAPKYQNLSQQERNVEYAVDVHQTWVSYFGPANNPNLIPIQVYDAGWTARNGRFIYTTL